MKHQAPITAVAAPARGRVRPFRSADGGRRGRSRAEARPTGVLEGSGVVGRVWVPAFAGMTGGRLVRLKAHPTGVGAGPDPRGWCAVAHPTGRRGGAVDSLGSPCISPPVPEAIPGFFVGVGGPCKGMPVGPQGQRTTPFLAAPRGHIEGDQR
jgi:hypothetical protein